MLNFVMSIVSLRIENGEKLISSNREMRMKGITISPDTNIFRKIIKRSIPTQ